MMELFNYSPPQAAASFFSPPQSPPSHGWPARRCSPGTWARSPTTARPMARSARQSAWWCGYGCRWSPSCSAPSSTPRSSARPRATPPWSIRLGRRRN